MSNPLDGKVGAKAKWSREQALMMVADWNAGLEKAGAKRRLKVVGGFTEWYVIEVDVGHGEPWEATPEEIEHEHAVVALYVQELADLKNPQAEFQKLVNRGDVKRRSDEIRRTQGLLRSNHKLPEPA